MTYSLSLNQSSPGKDALPCVSQDIAAKPPQTPSISMRHSVVSDTHVGIPIAIGILRNVSRRILTTVILLLVLMSGFSQPTWQRESPLPQEHALINVVSFENSEKVIAAGYGGTVMISSDLGDTWEIMHPGYSYYGNSTIWDLDFINDDIGYFCQGYSNIRKTVNGGYEWQRIEDCGSGGDIINIDFVNEDLGFVNVESQVLSRTQDGGESWETIENIPVAEYIVNLNFFDEQHGIVTEFPATIQQTSDGGDTWTPVFMDDDLYFDIGSIVYQHGDSTIFLSGKYFGNFRLIRSDDYGMTWDTVFSGQWDCMNPQCGFFDEMNGYLCLSGWNSNDVVTFQTSDGGFTWQECEPNNYYFNDWFMQSATVINDSTVMAVGARSAVHVSTDRGATWEPKFNYELVGEPVQTWYLDDGYTITLNRDSEFGSDYTLYQSDDDALTWEPFTLWWKDITVLDFLSRERCFLVDNTDSLRFYRSVDGGISWDTINTGFEEDATRMRFFNSQLGIIAGPGIILQTIDGGETWNERTPTNLYNCDVVDIRFFDEENVILTGESNNWNKLIWHSSDGGESWESREAILDEPKSICIVSEQTGYIAGKDNIVRTDDKGATWYSSGIIFNHPFDVYDIDFITADQGYAVGKGSTILVRSYESGSFWDEQVLDISSGLSKIHFYSPENAVILGENGLVLKSYDGGTTFIEEQPAIPAEPSAITLFPNPATDILNITFEEPQQRGELIFYNTAGTEVMRRTHNPNVAGIIMNIQTMDAGAYVVHYVVDGNIIETSKLIIQ